MAAVPTFLRQPELYTVAWICALPLEMAAAEAMLDEKHPELPTSPGDDIDGEAPLWWAARNRHEALVRSLLNKGARIDPVDKFGLSPLAWAVEKGHEPVVKLLVDLGADIRAADKSGQTPLSRAVDKQTRSLLLRNGA
ncbi:ankyrin repeat domain-containing protein [Aspergillus clavatus NRRL 1]|uniref:Ankyrin repeat protein n=1 Tax=Aspergillus clavatus (strain ATCC 1007 / CBS 513.65 / DSM 816 / NCTC 3887 / NRRL 1 / QM 1276 / 107) TaxID=344612 RepID=A1CIV9_ASPCL|nr:Ankyrin repeat protein [Aspergillus clavatus NRRL 1]EAW10814.1 Ankyrin repeat protein [Aspergillus clavatus NRRL 1]